MSKPYSFIKKIISKLEEKGKNFNDLILYFILVVFLRNTLESLLERDHILFLSEDFYTSIVMNFHFLFFYASILVSFLFITKIFIKRETIKILSVLVYSSPIIIIAPIIDFIISKGKGFDLSYPFYSYSLPEYILKALNPFSKFPGASPGMRIEVLIILILVFFYASILSKKVYTKILLPLFYLLLILLIGLIPLFISKGNPDFWKGGITPIDVQKFGLIFGFLFILIVTLYILTFTPLKFNIVRIFLNLETSLRNLFLTISGFFMGYILFAKDFEFFWKLGFNKFIPIFLLIPPLFYSLSLKKKYFYFSFLFLIFYSSFFSYIHIYLILFLYAIFFISKFEPIRIPFEAIVFFTFGYSLFTKERLFYLIDKKFFAYIFILFFFYGISRYFIINKNKNLGFVSFLLSLAIAIPIGFREPLYIFLFVSIGLITTIFYLFRIFSLRKFFILFYSYFILFIIIFATTRATKYEVFKLNSLLHLSKFKEAEKIYIKYKLKDEEIEPLFFYYTGRKKKFLDSFHRLKSKKEIIKWAECGISKKEYFNQIEENKFLFPYAYFFLKSFFDKKNRLKDLFLAKNFGFNSPILYEEIARIYIKKGKLEKALYYVEEGMNLKYSPSLEILKYTILGKMGKFNEAEKGFLNLIKRGLKNEVIYNNLGVIYLNKGEYHKALEFFEKAIEINPFYDEAIKNIKILKKILTNSF